LEQLRAVTKMTDHPNRKFLESIFTINVEKEIGKCKICSAVISYENRGMYLLENHYEIFHSDNISLFDAVVKVKSSEEILNKFFLIKNKKAACTSCKLQINIEYLDILSTATLTNLAKHYFSHHRYENNFLIFDKTTEN